MSTLIKNNNKWLKVAGSGVPPVDVVEEDNMNPVTSNAVAKALSNTEKTTGTGSRSIANVSSTNFGATWVKIGHTVQATVQLQFSRTFQEFTDLVAGFPKPVSRIDIFAMSTNIDNVYMMQLYPNGTLYSNSKYPIAEGQMYRATFTYLAEE